MFTIDEDAAVSISQCTDAVLIRMMLEPAGGGCPASSKCIADSYVPLLAFGRPRDAERARFDVERVGNVEVYFPPSLALKEGCKEIRLKLRKMLWFRWVELEGARGIVCYR